MQSDPVRLSPQNPWPGMRAFSEEDEPFFFGRERETAELLEVIQRAQVVVLYGQSGLGKTSLLNAGLFPRVRPLDMFPVRVRLTHGSAAPPLADQVKVTLAEELQRAGIGAPPPVRDETLWEYFHRADLNFWGPRNRLLTPLIVFDQFEELFTVGQKDTAPADRVERFRSELEALFEHRPPPDVADRMEEDEAVALRFDLDRRSARFVVVLREDFLAHLDTWRAQIPSLLAHRLRLEAMSADQALGVVQRAGGSLLEPEVAKRIVEFVSRSRRARGGRSTAHQKVEPALLSLVCQQLNDRRLALGKDRITQDLLATGTEMEAIVQNFYDEAFSGLDSRVREWVEDELLTVSGHRDRAALENAERAGIHASALGALIDRRVLHAEERDGVVWLELTHDLLTDPAVTSRDLRTRRREAEAAAAESQDLQRRIREELARPSGAVVDQARRAADALGRSGFVDVQPGGVDATKAAFVALAAEALAEHGRFDLAAEYCRRVSEAVEGITDPSALADVLVFARAQCRYVLGLVAYETGALAEAARLFEAVLALPAPAGDSFPAVSVVRSHFLAEIRLAGVAYRRGSVDDAHRRLEEVLTKLDTSAGQVVRDEIEAWRIQALQSLANVQEDYEADQTLARADRVLTALETADAANNRWRRQRAKLAADRAQKSLERGKMADAAHRCDQSDDASAALVLLDGDDLDWKLCRVKSLYALGQLHIARLEWDAGHHALTTAERICSEVMAAQPLWVQAVHDASIVQWHFAKLHEERSRTSSDSKAADLDAALVRYERGREITETVLQRTPDNARLQRALALFLGQSGRLLAEKGDLPAALDRFTACLSAFERLQPAARASREILDNEAYYLQLIADTLAEHRRVEESLAFSDRARGARRALASLSADAALQFENLAYVHERAAAFRRELNQLEEAASELQSAVQAVEHAVVAAGSATRPGARSHSGRLKYRAWLLESIARMWIDSGNTEKARPALIAAATAWMEVWEQLSWDRRVDATLQQLRGHALALDQRDLADRIHDALQLRADTSETRGGVRVAARPQNWPLEPLMPGPWRTLASDEVADELRELPRRDRGSSPSVPDVRPARVARVRRMILDCYRDGALLEASLDAESDEQGVVTYVTVRDQIAFVDGTGRPILDMNGRAGLQIDTPDRAAAYLLFFVNSIQAASGRFVLIHRVGDLDLAAEAPASLRRDLSMSIKPFAVRRSEAANVEWSANGTVQYGDSLYYVVFQLQSTGRVSMEVDVAFAERLPIFTQWFVDGIRLRLPGQQARVAAHLSGGRQQWREAAASMVQWIEQVERDFPLRRLPTEQLLAVACGDLSWYRLHARDFSGAIEAADAAIRRAENEPTPVRARAHALLFLDRLAEAKEWYAKYFEVFRRSDTRESPERALREELAILEKNGLTHPHLNTIRELMT